jgi:hypothetical protein
MSAAPEYHHIDTELAEGRVWRARELLAARVASSDFNPDLFRRYAAVLHAMGDYDEAGRFYMLAGANAGTEGLLADQFLQRRAQPLNELWAAMPAAAHRIKPESATGPMAAVLIQTGYDKTAVGALLTGLITRHAAAETRSFTLAIPHSVPSEASGIALALTAAALVFLGLLKLIEMVAAIVRYL